MNCTDFYNEKDYSEICEMVKREKIISILNSPFERKHKINGNEYELNIHTGRYVGTNEYYYSLMVDYNYANPPYSRQIGGGNYGKLNLSSYTDFCNGIDETLSKFPDYNEQIQISLF